MSESAGEYLNKGVVLEATYVDCCWLLIEAGLFSLRVAVLGGCEDESFIGEGQDDHAVVLLFLTFFEAPDVLGLVVANGIELFDFESLFDGAEIAFSWSWGVDGIDLGVALLFEISNFEIGEGAVLFDGIDSL